MNPRRLGVRLCVLYTAARSVEWAAYRLYAQRCKAYR
jgi:hypothetical protein